MIEVNNSTAIDEKMIKESQTTEDKRMQYAIVAIARQIMKVIIWKVRRKQTGPLYAAGRSKSAKWNIHHFKGT